MEEAASAGERNAKPTERVADAERNALRPRQRRDPHRLQQLREERGVHATVLQNGVELVRGQLQRRARELDRPLIVREEGWQDDVEGEDGSVLEGLADEQRKRQ